MASSSIEETAAVNTTPIEESDAPVEEFWLTTTDNPYDPFNEFESWLAFDEHSGYFTNGLLARLCLDSNNFSEAENDYLIKEAMQNICDLFPGLYNIVYKV